jgi:peptidoglycan/LPS O-acetylase OafA/YrhL
MGLRIRSEALGGTPALGAPHEIPALDGVRALAALSVVFYHAYQLWAPRKVLFGLDITIPWDYAQTGVHLFFVLSGFLLFLPFARAMLDGRALPSTRRFYQRRAWRILPTYWVCLVVLVLVQLPQFLSVAGVHNILAHLVFLHDDFQAFNRTIEGPFWTLALEVQFYLALPLFALGISKVVGASRSLARLTLGVLGLLTASLLVRGMDAFGFSHVSTLAGAPRMVVLFLIQSTFGTQGKFLEVFALGMLCAVWYIAVIEQRRLRSSAMYGLALLAVGVSLFLWLAPLVNAYHIEAPSYDLVAQPGNWRAFFGPFLIGSGYAAVLLAVLLIGVARSLVAMPPLRFVGLMSYSLYLWHLPFVHGWMPYMRTTPVGWRVLIAFAVAALSYLALERPFLGQRRRLTDLALAARRTPPSMPSERGAPNDDPLEWNSFAR